MMKKYLIKTLTNETLFIDGDDMYQEGNFLNILKGDDRVACFSVDCIIYAIIKD